MTILIASELGSGFGHATVIKQISESLSELGRESVAAVKDLMAARNMMGFQSGLKMLQAPMLVPTGKFARVNSFADILVEAGFSDEKYLATRLKAWIDLIRLVGARQVIIEHAPTALYAAHAYGLPILAVTSSFNIPPAQTPFPIMSPGVPTAAVERLKREQTIHGILCRSLEAIGLPSPETLQQAIKTLPTGLSSYPQLDHYGPREDAHYLGIPLKSFGPRHQWPDGTSDQPKIFVYAPWNPAIKIAMASLLKHRMRVCAVLNGAPKDIFSHEKNFLCMPGPVNISAALSECDVFVNHGSPKSVTQAIAAGKPTVMIPPWQEQELFSRRAMAAGAGILSHPDKAAESVHYCIRQLQETAELTKLREIIKTTDTGKLHTDFLKANLVREI